METVFVYGTLRNSKLRKKLSGRDIIPKSPDNLKGYEMSQVSDDGQTYPIIVKNDDSEQIIQGELIEITQAELLLFDCYEGPLYRRVKVHLESGENAWTYIQ